MIQNIHKLRKSLEGEEQEEEQVKEMTAAEITSPSHTKVSISVIGDVFVDLFCYLEGNDYPVLGGDVRIAKPSECHLSIEDSVETFQDILFFGFSNDNLCLTHD